MLSSALRDIFGAQTGPVELLPHDGTCNTMPGWGVTWNPTSARADPDCKLFPFYAHRGMGAGASYGQSNFAVAPASVAAMANAKA